MTGPIDKIYVEITADQRALDQSMQQAERRVDRAAKKMNDSMKKAEAGIGGTEARVQKSLFTAVNRRSAWFGGMSAIGAAYAISRVGQNFESGSMSRPYGAMPQGYQATGFDKAYDAALDFADALGKSIPIVDGVIEGLRKLQGSIWPDRIGQELAKIGERYTFDDMRSQLEIQRKLQSPAAVKRMEGERDAQIQNAWREFVNTSHSIGASPKFSDSEKNDLRSLAGEVYAEAKKRFEREYEQALERLHPNDPMRKGKGKGGVDSFSTMLGTYRAPWMSNEVDKATADAETKQAEEAKKTSDNTKRSADSLQRLERAIGRGPRVVVVA